jgi:excisionase family DNA binding protein
MGPLLSVKDVAVRLNVSSSTVYDLVAVGELPCFRIGARGRGVLRFTEEMVAKYLEDHLVRGPDKEDDAPLRHIR